MGSIALLMTSSKGMLGAFNNRLRLRRRLIFWLVLRGLSPTIFLILSLRHRKAFVVTPCFSLFL